MRKFFFFFFISVPGKHDDHDHDVADEPQDEDPEVGHKEQEDHAWGHDQRLLDLVTADQTGNTWVGRSLLPGSGFCSKIDFKR
jgi:hypothetical protein